MCCLLPSSCVRPEPAGPGRLSQKRHFNSPCIPEARIYTDQRSCFLTGSLPLSVSALSPRVQDLHKRVRDFVNTHCIPLEQQFHEYHSQPDTKWTIHPKMEELKVSEREYRGRIQALVRRLLSLNFVMECRKVKCPPPRQVVHKEFWQGCEHFSGKVSCRLTSWIRSSILFCNDGV